MKTSRIVILISSLLFAVTAIFLIGVLMLNSSLEPVLFEFIILNNLITACFTMSILFVALFIAVLIFKKHFNTEKILIVFVIMVYGGIATFAFNSYKAYDEEWEIWRNADNIYESQEVMSYLPYNTEIGNLQKGKQVYQLSMNYSDDIVYVNVFDKIYNAVDYSVEYFEIENDLLMTKFISDREVSSVFNDYVAVVSGDKNEGSLNGVDYSAYVNNKSDYVVVIKDEKRAYYSYLYSADRINVSLDDFIKVSVEQFAKTKKLVENPEIIV